MHLARAMLLQGQGRHELAEKEARLAILDNPDDPFPRIVLSECLSELKQYAESVEEARQAIAAAPALAAAHFALARAEFLRRHVPEAEAAIREAIRLDLNEPNHFALLAALRQQREQWTGVLEAADRGLALEAEHLGCLNLRSMALTKLGRQAEARATAEGALERDPDDAFTHATRGWGLLHEGNPQQALVHFRESLRLDPEDEFARAGMVEALKARYWPYRILLGFFLWMTRLSPSMRWGFVLGLLVLQQVAAAAARDNPGLRPILDPLLIAYVAFVMLTWTAIPLSNLALRCNRFGRHALSREERRASLWVALFASFALVGVGWGLFAGELGVFGWPIALGYAILLVPISGTCRCSPGWPRHIMLACTIAMVGVMVAVTVLIGFAVDYLQANDRRGLDYAMTAIVLMRWLGWAGLGSSILANWLAGVRPRL